jgi:hypothetical protein
MALTVNSGPSWPGSPHSFYTCLVGLLVMDSSCYVRAMFSLCYALSPYPTAPVKTGSWPRIPLRPLSGSRCTARDAVVSENMTTDVCDGALI